MGTLASTLTQVSSTLGTLNTISQSVQQLTGDNTQRKSQNLAMKQLQTSQVQEKAQAERNAQLDRKNIALQADQDAVRRRKALKRAMAKQKASRGASGTSAGGSGEAVLLGLYNESDDEARQRENLDKIRYNALDNDLYTLSERNILEKQQLSEQQRLQRVKSQF
jgi:hypothetical protein